MLVLVAAMDRINLEIDGDEYWVEGGDFDDMLEVVKELRGRRFDSETKAWVVSGTPNDIARELAPFRLMFVDSDPLADSTPNQVRP